MISAVDEYKASGMGARNNARPGALRKISSGIGSGKRVSQRHKQQIRQRCRSEMSLCQG